MKRRRGSNSSARLTVPSTPVPIFTMTVFTQGIVKVEPHRNPPGGDLNAAVLEGLRLIVTSMEAGELIFEQVP